MIRDERDDGCMIEDREIRNIRSGVQDVWEIRAYDSRMKDRKDLIHRFAISIVQLSKSIKSREKCTFPNI